MATKYGKKTLKDKVNGGLRTAFMSVAALGAMGGVGYYNYGTVQEQEVKVRAYDTHIEYEEGGAKKGYYTFETDKGIMIAEKSRLHLQSQEDADKIYQKISADKTYKIKTYGVDIAGTWRPNILEAREVTEDELKARAADKLKRETEAKARAAGQPVVQPGQVAAPVAQAGQPVAAPVAGVLSGRVTTMDILTADGKNTVQITMPIEAAGKVVVGSVTPLQAAPVAPAAPVAVPPPAPKSSF